MATIKENLTTERSEQEGTISTLGLMKDVVGENVTHSSVMLPKDLTDSLPASSRITPNQDLLDFLARPQVIASGNYTNSSPHLMTSGDLVAPLANPIYAEKLNGFGGVRWTTRITLQVNAQNFQQGLLYLAYIPLYTENIAREDVRTTTVWLSSQLPKVELDISCDTEAVLEIPFVHTELYYDWTNASQGSWFLFSYSALGSGTGTLSAPYTIWFSMHDVELFAPTTRRAISQIGRTEDDSNNNSASRLMRLTSNVFSTIGKVPILGTVANPLSWVTGIGADVLTAFGWSKQINTEPVSMMSQVTSKNVQNADIPAPVEPAGLFATNNVQIMDSAGVTGVDEMSLSYIVTRRSFIQTATWADSNSTGDLLFSIPVSPAYGSGAYGPARVSCPVAGVSSQFEYWRGSLRYRFKVVKTQFHSGRLMVMFVPGVAVAAANTISTSTYLLRNVIDLREGSDFTVEVPYVAPRPWTPFFNATIGTIYVRVLNPLRMPPTASLTVPIIVELSGGEDFKVAVPNAGSVPYLASAIPPSLLQQQAAEEQLNKIPQTTEEVEYEPYPLEPYEEEEVREGVSQVGDAPTIDADPCVLYDGGIGGAITTDSLAPSMFCIGEQVSSVKQLINVPQFQSAGPTLPYTTFVTTQIMPHVMIGSANTTPVVFSDVMAFWSTCYSFSRGGIDVHLLPSTETTLSYKYSRGDPALGAYSSGPPTAGWGHRTNFETTNKKRVTSIRCPMYWTRHTRLNYLLTAPATPVGVNNRGSYLRLNFLTAQEYLLLGRSGADDFQFQMFLGIYPHIPPN